MHRQPKPCLSSSATTGRAGPTLGQLCAPLRKGPRHAAHGKATGVGAREMGEAGLEFFTEEKAVYVDYTGAKREGNLY